ncbi:hypothetical protein AVEN_71944-1 [Araneus ventricosus]|uniref:Uncharacterized protein n=1 Tax=Araneus ventricosus TaxID=182803 RepID=A0A4Y2F748_ARAVE|nr:hypothetical protein AVEN_71944-1 [Araneus ventricosus]
MLGMCQVTSLPPSARERGIIRNSPCNSEQHDGYLVTDIAILYHGEMARKTSELAPPHQAYAPHQWENVWPSTSDIPYNRPKYTSGFQRNRASNEEPSSSEA